MKIPYSTKKPRYYIAISNTKAFSSWDTYEEAIDCIDRFKKEAKIDSDILNDLKLILGIIETGCLGKSWVLKV